MTGIEYRTYDLGIKAVYCTVDSNYSRPTHSSESKESSNTIEK
jgi:hypothetical protein